MRRLSSALFVLIIKSIAAVNTTQTLASIFLNDNAPLHARYPYPAIGTSHSNEHESTWVKSQNVHYKRTADRKTTIEYQVTFSRYGRISWESIIWEIENTVKTANFEAFSR